MTTRDSELGAHIMLLEHLNLSMVIDQARVDPNLLDQIIWKLEERGVDDRTQEENSLLEWARSTQRAQRKTL
ncbi:MULTISPECIES: hypothetical protein [unclassified Pseudomonas]|uniref:hypothetical protein n=1 Tax=unclassified Pseudomonas TaxID=196821 RepID=UPI00131AB0E1|nr:MULTISPECIES: hypothetical protein [unclassified Pseudomonas]